MVSGKISRYCNKIFFFPPEYWLCRTPILVCNTHIRTIMPLRPGCLFNCRQRTRNAHAWWSSKVELHICKSLTPAHLITPAANGEPFPAPTCSTFWFISMFSGSFTCRIVVGHVLNVIFVTKGCSKSGMFWLQKSIVLSCLFGRWVTSWSTLTTWRLSSSFCFHPLH